MLFPWRVSYRFSELLLSRFCPRHMAHVPNNGAISQWQRGPPVGAPSQFVISPTALCWPRANFKATAHYQIKIFEFVSDSYFADVCSQTFVFELIVFFQLPPTARRYKKTISYTNALKRIHETARVPCPLYSSFLLSAQTIDRENE